MSMTWQVEIILIKWYKCISIKKKDNNAMMQCATCNKKIYSNKLSIK
jgi:hypothetical protein